MAARNYIAAIERTLKAVETFNGQREASPGELARSLVDTCRRISTTLKYTPMPASPSAAGGH